MLKKIKIYGSILIILIIALVIIKKLTSDEVGDVSLGMFTLKAVSYTHLTLPTIYSV